MCIAALLACGDGGSASSGEQPDTAGCDPSTNACPCPTGTHRCGAACVDDHDVEQCGAACTPCPGGENATPVCDGSACRLECEPGTLSCDGTCAVCPAETLSVACLGRACVRACEAGLEPCDAGCCGPGQIFTGMTHAPSITVDAQDRPQVAFIVDGAVTHARLDGGVWTTTTVGGGFATATAIVIGADDEPWIAYTADRAIGLARSIGGEWTHETAYASDQDPGPKLWQQGLVLDSSGRPHIAAAEVAGALQSTALHVWRDGGGWQVEQVHTVNNSPFSRPSLAIDDDDVLHMTWINSADGYLMYAADPGGVWTTSTATMNGTCCNSSFIALDSMGRPFLAYETSPDQYGLADRTSGTWTFEPIHDPPNTVGNLRFDSKDGLHHLRIDGQADLRYARPEGSGWQETVLDSNPGDFMLTIDEADRAHVVWSTISALRYVQP